MKKIFTPKIVTILAFVLIFIELYFSSTTEETLEVLAMILVVWLAITIHELGHIIFGKIVGFEFVSFTIGPIKVEKNLEGIKLKENTEWGLAGGMTMMMPPLVKKEEIRKKKILYSAGGPIFSLVFSLIGLIIYSQVNHVVPLYFSIINVAIFVATIIPTGKGGMASDGYFIFSLIKNDEKSLKLIEDMLICGEVLSNKTPSEWNMEYVQLAKQKIPCIDNVMYGTMMYYFDIEQHGFQYAQERMDGYKNIPITEHNSKSLAGIIHMQQLTSFLVDNESNQLEKIIHYQQFLSLIEPVSFYRGHAILAYLQDDMPQALKNIEKVKKVIEKYEEKHGFFKVEKTLTNMVEEKIVSGNA
jgi:hypothetical protein